MNIISCNRVIGYISRVFTINGDDTIILLIIKEILSKGYNNNLGVIWIYGNTDLTQIGIRGRFFRVWLKRMSRRGKFINVVVIGRRIRSLDP